MQALVQYLTRRDRNKEEQAKAIAIWIASHIAYDNYTLSVYEKDSNHQVSGRLKKGDQDAQSVLKNKIGTCEGYANLYSAMLNMANIPNQKVHGFVLERQPNASAAKRAVKKEDIGHVWNKLKLNGKDDLLVDVTFMSRGKAGAGGGRLMAYQKTQEIRKLKREHATFGYDLSYFGFDYADLQNHGEYRFDKARKVIKK